MNTPLSPIGDFLVTSGNLGRCRPASGTWGSLPPVALAAVLLALGIQGESLWFGLAMMITSGLACGACVRYGDAAVAQFGKPDPSQVVADETAGMALVLAFLPTGATDTFSTAIVTLGLAFVAFRLLDILKPFPADWLEGRAGGWGILLDDLMAGVYAIVVVHVAAMAL